MMKADGRLGRPPRRVGIVAPSRRRGASLAKGLLVALCVLSASSATEMAKAQANFIPDTGAHVLLGPKQAAGVVIWSHGRSLSREDAMAPTPFYVEALRQQGWDALRFNRLRAVDDLDKSPAALANAARELKGEGYKRVVLAGQSFGAFISLIAADQSDDVDAVIATAPAAYPPWGAWSQFNALKLYPLLERIRHARVMLFYFQDDKFDPGGRGARSETILDLHGVPHLVVDRPPGLSTHWAAGTEQFAADWANCITAFAFDDAAHGPLDCAMLERSERVAGRPLAPTTRGSADTRAERQAQRAPLAGSAVPEGLSSRGGAAAAPR